MISQISVLVFSISTSPVLQFIAAHNIYVFSQLVKLRHMQHDTEGSI